MESEYADLYTMFSNRCALITATIEPNVPDLVQVDITQRKADYLNALKFYRKALDIPIYFLENSNYDLAGDKDFQEIFKTGVELLKFPVSTKPELGKGYQEFQLLDAAISGLPDEFKSIIKLTGRYRVENIVDLSELSTTGLIADLHRKMEVAITGCFIAERGFYEQHMQGLYEKCNDAAGEWIERVLYRKIKEEHLWDKVSMFPENPTYKGVPGSHDGTLERHPLKMKLRNAERKVLRALNVHQFPYEY